MSDPLFDSLEPDAQQEIWARLDELLENDFDFAKIVILEIDSASAMSEDWDQLEVRCWTDRQGAGESPIAPLSPDEVTWLAKHIGENEASVIRQDFGMEGIQAAVVYCITYSENEEIEPVTEEYTCFTRNLLESSQ
jgi:hypothetical protein